MDEETKALSHTAHKWQGENSDPVTTYCGSSVCQALLLPPSHTPTSFSLHRSLVAAATTGQSAS